MHISRLGTGSVVIGLLTRLAIAPYTSWSNDNAVWFHTSLAGFFGLHLYDRPGFSYFPVWGYCLQILGSVIRLLGMPPSFFGVQNPDFAAVAAATGDFSTTVTSPAFNVLFKAVLFAADLGTALLMFHFVMVMTSSQRRAQMAFALWFLNPFVIYESAVNGAFDVIVGLAVLASVLLFVRERPLAGAVAWMVAIMTKLSPAFLGLQFMAFTLASKGHTRSITARMRAFALFAIGSALALALLLAPELLFGSVPALIHNVFARTQSQVAVGGLSVFGIRHLKPWAWLLDWGYANSAAVIQATSIAQVAAAVAWSGWTLVASRTSPTFALLTGTVGTLGSVMLLSPSANPQYYLWWLPALIVVVVITGRGYWQLGLLSVVPLIFDLAILGPTAVLAPLATYTGLVPAHLVANAMLQWNGAPGGVWGTYLPDDFFGPAALITVASLGSLFISWFRVPPRVRRRFEARIPEQSFPARR